MKHDFSFSRDTPGLTFCMSCSRLTNPAGNHDCHANPFIFEFEQHKSLCPLNNVPIFPGCRMNNAAKQVAGSNMQGRASSWPPSRSDPAFADLDGRPLRERDLRTFVSGTNGTVTGRSDARHANLGAYQGVIEFQVPLCFLQNRGCHFVSTLRCSPSTDFFHEQLRHCQRLKLSPLWSSTTTQL